MKKPEYMKKSQLEDVDGLISGYNSYASKYTKKIGNKLKVVYLEIEKVPKELKYKTAVLPMIKLFCKSLGKCSN